MPSRTSPLLSCPFPGLGLLLALLIPVAGHGKQAYPFSVDIERFGQEHRLVARNRGPAPISVKVTLTSADNAASDQIWPLYAVIRPHAETSLARIYAANTNRGYRFSTQVVSQVGNYHALHDRSAHYRLPFENGRAFIISQAPGAPPPTHDTPDSRYAVDISMPEGTPVLAARQGTVIEVESANQRGAREQELLKMANFVRILHDDESIAIYAHLAPNGVFVQPGQKVRSGTLIGLSGSTGYSSGPHLHFAVQQLSRGQEKFELVSVPFLFTVGNPPYVFTPEILQQVRADYESPGQPPATVQIHQDARNPSPKP